MTTRRFENYIKVSFSNDRKYFRFDPTDDPVRVREVFTNYRCRVFQALPHDLGINRDMNFWIIGNPEPGCMVMAGIDHLEPTPGTVDLPTHRYVAGYAAFIFDGDAWQTWRWPHDIEVCSDFTDGLKITINGLRDTKLVAVNSRGHRHELISFEHMLDYCAGKRSLADILTLVEMEERRRSQNERQRTYKELLALARKLKGAVRSKTAAQIEELLTSLAGEDLTF